MLGAKGPGVAWIGGVAPLGSAVVFGIEADEVEAEGEALVSTDQTSDFEHHCDAAGAVVGSEDGRMMISGVRVVVGPRTAVPVGAEQDTVLSVRVVAGDDVGAAQGGAVVASEGGVLFCDGHAVVSEFRDDPAGAGVVGRTVHRAGAEGALGLAESVGAVSAEDGAHGGGSGGVGGGGLLAEAAGEEEKGEEEED